jgi:hypothetical protein
MGGTAVSHSIKLLIRHRYSSVDIKHESGQSPVNSGTYGDGDRRCLEVQEKSYLVTTSGKLS